MVEKIGKEKKAEKKGDYTMGRRDPSIEKLCDPVLLDLGNVFSSGRDDDLPPPRECFLVVPSRRGLRNVLPPLRRVFGCGSGDKNARFDVCPCFADLPCRSIC